MSVRSPVNALLVVVLAALALVVLALLRTPAPGVAAEGPAGISIKASLDSCTEGPERTCQITVGFDALDNAQRYEATISAPDGSVLLTAPATPGAEAYSVSYVGNGTYSVRITAFGSSSG